MNAHGDFGRPETRSHQSFPVFRALTPRRKSRLERALSVLADVRPGEGGAALLLAVNVFLILGAYYMLKTVREVLILTQGGAEVKSYAAAGQALLLLLVVPAYGAFASKVNRMRLIGWVTVFFMSHLVIFYALGKAGAREGVVYFLWLGIFNVLVISQFWAFANDLYTEAQGKRLFPIIGLGSSLGAWLGAQAAGRMIGPVGPYSMMLIACGILGVCILLSMMVHKRESAGPKAPAQAAAPLGKQGGFELIFKDRYLLLIATLIVLLNIVNSSGEFLLGKMVVAQASQLAGSGAELAAAKQKFIGQFYGQFFSWVNLISLIFQMFFVSRIFHYIGVRGALFILPVIAMGGNALILFYPVLAAVRVVKIFENSTDYSIQNTTRQALFLPTSREAKYKAKAAIDTFFMRLGDVLQAGVVFVGTQMSFSITGFAALNVALALVWLLVVAAIYREHRKRSEIAAATKAA